MIYLRQSTASQEVPLGPFLDSTDGDTAKTGLTIANTDIKIWKAGATTLANKNSGGATHISGGIYYAVLDATDTNTLGSGEINVHVSGALAVRREFTVLSANVYDALITGTVDGVDTGKLLMMLLSFMCGKVSKSDSAGVRTLTYKKQDGSTTLFTSANSTTDGTRASTGSIS